MDGGHYYGLGSLSFHRQSLKNRSFEPPDYSNALDMHLFEFQEYRGKMAETIQQLQLNIAHMEEQMEEMKERKREKLSQKCSKSIISKLQF